MRSNTAMNVRYAAVASNSSKALAICALLIEGSADCSMKCEGMP